MARPEKVAEVQAITERLQNAQSIVLADYQGLTVEQMTNFRVKCRENNIDCRVVKNRLARIACDNADTAILKDHLKGPMALVFGPESQVDPAKIVVDFAKENDKMEVKGGYVDGQYLDASEVVALSKVPSRDEIMAKIMACLNSPASGLAMSLNGVASGLTRCIDGMAKAKAEAEA